MSDNQEQLESKPADQHNIEHQQQDLFRELSREQVEAEKALADDQERVATGKPQDEIND